jgi:hypothetical protein
LKRFLSGASTAIFSDAPDTAQREEDAVARQVAIELPMLILIRQNDLEEDSWRGTPFSGL